MKQNKTGIERDHSALWKQLRQHFDDWRGDTVVFNFLLVLSLLFTVSRAFISAEIPTASARLVFWWLILAQLYILFGLSGAMIALVTGKRFRGNLKLEMIASLIVPLAMGILGRVTLLYFADIPLSLDGFITSYMRYMITMPILVFSANRVRALWEFYTARHKDGDSVVEPDATIRPLRSVDTRSVPQYIEAEDHHVKIVYADRVIYRRAALTQEMENWSDHGHQVHRSYWVSCATIAGRAREGRTLYLILKSGDRIPVGRKYESTILAQVKAAVEPEA